MLIQRAYTGRRLAADPPVFIAADLHDKGNPMINLPNGLTILRVLFVPCFFLFLYYGLAGINVMIWFARTVVVFIVVSDFFDGYLARKRGEITQLGSVLDPMADKLFVTASYVLLAAFEKIHAWLAITVVTKDILVCIGWIVYAVLFNKIEVNPTLLAKFATAMQYITVCYIVLTPMDTPLFGLDYITAAATAAALFHYGYLASRYSTALNHNEE